MSSKVFETQLYIKNYQSNVIQQLIAFGVSGVNIKVIDNWQYDNETQIERLNEIEEEINNGKIVVIEGEYKKLDCGCFVSKITANCYEFDIWISAKISGDLKDECVSKNNSHIYDRVIDFLKKWIDPHELILCVSGIEMYVEYSNDLNEVLDNSSGILQMICSRNTVMPNNLSFNVIQDGEYVIIRP